MFLIMVLFFIYPIYFPFHQHSIIQPFYVDYDLVLQARDLLRYVRVRQHPIDDELRSSELQEGRRVIKVAAGVLKHDVDLIYYTVCFL